MFTYIVNFKKLIFFWRFFMKNQNKKGKSFYLDFEDEKTFSNFLSEQLFKIDSEIFLNRVHLHESGSAGWMALARKCTFSGEFPKEMC